MAQLNHCQRHCLGALGETMAAPDKGVAFHFGWSGVSDFPVTPKGEVADRVCRMHIEGRVFIITGASSGIGLSTAIALAERGTKVALLARTKVALDELAAGPPESFAFPVDMKDFKVVQRVIGAVCEQYGRIDGLVNSASIFLRCRNDRRYMSVSCLVPSDSH